MLQGAGLERWIRWVASVIVTALFLGLCAVHDQGRRGHELYIRNWLNEPVAVSGSLRQQGREWRRFILEAMPNSLTEAYALPRMDSRHEGELTFETGQGPLPYRVPMEFHNWDPAQHRPVVISLYPNRFYITHEVPSAARPWPVALTLERLMLVIAVFGSTFTFLRWIDNQARPRW